MLRIQRSANGEVVLTLSGRMDAENVAEVEAMIESEQSHLAIVLDLKDLTLVDRNTVEFLARCETAGIELKDCPPYIREWINRERSGS